MLTFENFVFTKWLRLTYAPSNMQYAPPNSQNLLSAVGSLTITVPSLSLVDVWNASRGRSGSSQVVEHREWALTFCFSDFLSDLSNIGAETASSGSHPNGRSSYPPGFPFFCRLSYTPIPFFLPQDFPVIRTNVQSSWKKLVRVWKKFVSALVKSVALF